MLLTSQSNPYLPLLTRAFSAVCELEGVRECAAEIRFLNDEEIRALNRETRGVDAATDVLSFPAIDWKGKRARARSDKLAREYDPEIGLPMIGEIALNVDRARAQAAEFGHSAARETAYLVAHSALHLLGYDHETDEDKREMREREEQTMDKIGLTRDEAVSDRALFEAACEMTKMAYAPYSDFAVGACLLAADGRIFGGCNIENACYGAGICAERAAVSSAVSNGAREFTAIAVAGKKGEAWPCGICRQVLYEFAPNLRVIAGKVGGDFTACALSDLLPRAFGPKNLEDK